MSQYSLDKLISKYILSRQGVLHGVRIGKVILNRRPGIGEDSWPFVFSVVRWGIGPQKAQ